MKAWTRFGVRFLTACLPAIMAAGLAAGVAASPQEAEEDRTVPPTPAPILDIVSIQPFTLEAPATHGWRAERPAYTSGYLLVLRVDRAYVLPRQVAEPVLYVGRQTAERVNHGYESGRVVAVVPAEIDDPKHPDHLDLTKTLIWFGTPDLPERVDARVIEREHLAAQAAVIRPAPAARVANARARGGATLRANDKRALIRAAAELVRLHSPQERALVDRLLQR